MSKLTLTLLGVAVFLATGCHAQNPARPAFSLEEASGVCSEVRFPAWTFPAPPVGHGRLAYRQPSAGPASAILIGADRSHYGNEEDFAAQKYRLDMRNPAQMTTASDAAWKQARLIMLWDHNPREDDSQPSYSNGGRHPDPSSLVLFGRKSYQKSGFLWPPGGGYNAAVLSPDSKWLLVQSLDGPAPQGDGFLQGGSPRQGAFYLEVFRTTDGQRTFRLKGQLNGFEAENLIAQNGWFGEHYLVLNLDPTTASIACLRPGKDPLGGRATLLILVSLSGLGAGTNRGSLCTPAQRTKRAHCWRQGRRPPSRSSSMPIYRDSTR